MTSTPFLNLPQDATLWMNEENSWWRLNLDHAWLKEGKPYFGVLQAEVLPRDDGHVVTLGVSTAEGAHVFMFAITDKQGVKPFEENRENGEKKALKIASELIHHLPDPALKEKIGGQVMQRLSQLELTAEQSVWDRF
ncbi:hypothetical protein HY994_06560 [Candidatus Micrarchaeota archaeon]|nr:hypothetical protein [Candidatus Micrarchaeota archaeon]